MSLTRSPTRSLANLPPLMPPPNYPPPAPPVLPTPSSTSVSMVLDAFLPMAHASAIPADGMRTHEALAPMLPALETSLLGELYQYAADFEV